MLHPCTSLITGIHSFGLKFWIKNNPDLPSKSVSLLQSLALLSHTVLEHKFSQSNSDNLHQKIQWHKTPGICVGLNKTLFPGISFPQLCIHPEQPTHSALYFSHLRTLDIEARSILQKKNSVCCIYLRTI